MTHNRPTRRDFLGAAGSVALFLQEARAGNDAPPGASGPRATDGDDRFEPNWDERLTLTVGQVGRETDLVGRDDKVIQAAIQHVVRLGGGTVKLLPGTFVLRHPVVLPSRIRLVGSGAETILTKIVSRTVALDDDSDWYDREITLADAQGFKVGDGVVLRATNPHTGGPLVIKRTLVARSGNRFRLDSGLRENLWVAGKPTCTAMFPLLNADHAADVVVENLTLDGDKANNPHLDGNYAGCVFIQDCNRFTFRSLTARNYNGDGISFQISHDVVVENCQCIDNADLGVHPGSGSQRPLIRHNHLDRNTIGLFWCWGVKFGLAHQNHIQGNRDYGVSFGHHDTDNVIRDNTIMDSGKVGILFRDESRGKDFWPNRNRVESNEIVNSGGDEGVAIDVQGRTREIKITDNVFRETRGPSRRTGLRVSADAGSIELANNRFDGFSKDLADARKRP